MKFQLPRKVVQMYIFLKGLVFDLYVVFPFSTLGSLLSAIIKFSQQ